jgi:tetratricopeptide (TPR) repeat protein
LFLRVRIIKFSAILLVVSLSFSSCKTSKSAGNAGAGTSREVANPAKKQADNPLSETSRLEFDKLYFDANKEQILGNMELAANLFSQCIKLDPNNAAAIYELAKIYNFNGNKEKAIELSGKAANIDQKNSWYQLLYADLLFANKQYLAGTEIYQRIIKINPGKIDMYFELAEGYVFANKPEEAIKVYDKVESLIGVNDEGSMQKVKVYTQLKKTDKAIRELNKLILFNPKEPKYLAMLGEIYQNSGQKEKAAGAYAELLKIDPENPYVHLALAHSYFEQKQDAKGLEEYKEAFRNPKLDIDTKMKILLDYYDQSATKPALKEDALSLCQVLIETHPDEAKSYSIYGDFLLRDKKLSEARDAFRKANARDKTKYVIWDRVLILDSDLSDFDSMLSDSKEAIELFPAEPLGYLFNGIAYLQKKNFQPAIDILKEGKDFVVDNKPLLTQFYASLGDALHELKNFAASDSAYEKALELDPKNITVLNNYAYYLSVRKENLQHAEEMSKITVDAEPANNSYLDTYGWILYQKGKYEDAKKWIGKALDNGAGSNGVILEHYGDILFKMGNTEKALEYWNNAKSKGGSSEFLDKKIADKKLYE